jgi:hypothetical protein
MRGLYLLAAPSTPEAAKQEAIGRAEAGESVTLTTVKEIVGRAKQAGRETRRDASKQHKDAGRARQDDGRGGMAGIHNKQTAAETPQLTFSPILEQWKWDIIATKRHFKYAMEEAKKFKCKISRAEVNAVAHTFNDIANLAIDATEEMMKELKARGPK